MFPAPTPSYTSAGFIGEIIYIPKYARDAQSGEVVQFTDPSERAAAGQSSRPTSPNVLDPDSAKRKENLRRSVLGDASFSKEELAMKSIREEAKKL